MPKNNAIWLVVGGMLLLIFLPATAAGAATGGAVAVLSYLGMSGYPRGMKNNNPGNIRISNNAWQGKIPVQNNTDGAFEQFSTYVYGIRAMIKNLLSYYRDYNLNTLQKIISKWAPAADNNDTNSYINVVAQRTGFSPTQQINLEDPATMRKVVIAMAAVENGRDAVTPEQFNYAWTIV